MVHRSFATLILAIFLIFPAMQARAACSNPGAAEGDIMYSQPYHTYQFCDGTLWKSFAELDPAAGGPGCTSPSGAEGVLIYNGDYHLMQFCNGTNWVAVGQSLQGGGAGGLSGPSDCANIGDLCADGTVFAGRNPITQDQLFIPSTDQGTTSVWKTSTGADDIATDSTYDGRANTNQVANSTTFPAFKLCKDLTTGGHSDWYLPSQVELYYLWAVKPTIQAKGHITNFLFALYWSSTEFNSNLAWSQNFTDGGHYLNNKDAAYRVRCVRR